MRNIAIIISYDGTNYCGWQVQPNGVTVAEKINDAIYGVTQKRTKLYGSGRTDSGVHAYAQVANFFTDFKAPCEKLVPALNAYLPNDIRVLRAYDVDDEFNARFSAVGKTYVYDLYCDRVFSPFYVNRAYWVKYDLDIDKMKKACEILRGEHDFNAFMASGSYVTDTVRNLYELDVEKSGNIIRITASANGFLYNMVRILTGTLIYAGCGKLNEENVADILYGLKREKGAPTVPPDGLYLKQVYYAGKYEYVI